MNTRKNIKRSKKNIRLSKNLIPSKYDIQLRPDLMNFTFEGVETINLALSNKTNELTLHSKEIEIETANIEHGKDKIFAHRISYNDKSETATFHFLKPLSPGKLRLTLVFRGILNDKMRGFYRSKYNIEGKDYHMATTQFEATDARRAFPCFDEPAHKAVFHVSLIVPIGKTAISNTLPVSIREHDKGFEIIRFAPTPKMSTYLLAFIIGDFEYLEKKTKNGIRVRVYTTPKKKHQSKFALDCAVKTLEFYEDYFDIKYPLPVLDMIAIPDFSSGAMENWGAITYRESALLVDEDYSSSANKQWVALVVAHELAHQWFGNLVTMEWWTHLWLNEGFASYIEYLAVDKLFPKWDIWTQFSTNDLGIALRLDALMSTHPIEVEVHHPDEIGEIFDEVSYSKGASVIRMLANYLGEKNFRDGLRYYLKKHSYKNTETIHLWQAFEKISKKPVQRIMHEWTSKSGYPLVSAKLKGNKLHLTQERFYANPVSKKKANDRTIWKTPITLGNTKTNKTILFASKNGAINTKDWTKINLGETGFFRTAYDPALLEKLKTPVKNKLLSARDRLGIVRDLFALSEAGAIPTTDALDFISAYKNEEDYSVWLEIAMGVGRVEQLIAKENSTVKDKYNEMIISLFTPLLERLSWEKKSGEQHTDTLLRSLAISRLGRSRDKTVAGEARKRFFKSKHGNHIHPDIRSAIYGTVAANGGMKEFRTLVNLYKKENLHEEKNRIGYALGDFSDPKILKLASDFALSTSVRTQDTVGILSGIGANPIGRDVWWNFIQKNWKTLVTRYGQGGLTLGRAVKAIGGSAEEKHLTSFKKFFSTHDAPGGKRSIEQVTERLEGNVLWLKRDKKNIENFLKNLSK